jgi:DNA-binding MarR family transcriptional regulator
MYFLPVIKELARTFQAFEGFSSPHIRSLGLTPVQFDVIATLANQEPMTFKELGEKTLISKSSLTGVVERMVQKGLVSCIENEVDARSQKLMLTSKGQKTFDKVFPAHLAHLKVVFDRLTSQQLHDIEKSLQSLHSIFFNPKKDS